MVKKIAFFVCLTIMAACTEKKAEKFSPLPFPLVSAPAMISSQQELAEYYSKNYWNSFTSAERAVGRCDSAFVSSVPRMEVLKAFGNYLAVLDQTSIETAKAGIRTFTSKIQACEKRDSSSNIYNQLVEIASKYLYDPNSPYRNEDYYQAFAEEMSKSDLVDETSRDTYTYEAKMCSRNAVGTFAENFTFSDRKGKTGSLYGVKAEYTVLFFTNPGCNACLEIIEFLKDHPKVAALIDSGRIAVVNVYIDEDLQAWLEYEPTYPKTWTNVYDHNYIIRGDDLYFVRAIPSLYLLDAQKRVMMKDVPQEKLFAFLNNLQ